MRVVYCHVKEAFAFALLCFAYLTVLATFFFAFKRMEEKEGNGVFSAPSPAAASVVVAAQAQARATDVSEDYVQLHSGDDHVFYVLRDVALGSKTIERMLSGSFQESDGVIRFPELSTEILEKVIEYLYYKHKFSNSASPIPEFEIEPESAMELLMAANFLNC